MAQEQLPDEVKKVIKETFFKDLTNEVVLEVFTQSPARTTSSTRPPSPSSRPFPS